MYSGGGGSDISSAATGSLCGLVHGGVALLVCGATFKVGNGLRIQCFASYSWKSHNALRIEIHNLH